LYAHVCGISMYSSFGLNEPTVKFVTVQCSHWLDAEEVNISFQLPPCATVNLLLFMIWAPVNLHASVFFWLHSKLASLATVYGVMSKFSLFSLGITQGTH